MVKINIKSLFLTLFVMCFWLYSYEVYLDATKQKQDFSKIVISNKDIESFSDLQQVLKYYGIDIYSRSNTQYDISLNAGTFEQVKILLDGVPINDPQTGHHNCNIPISLSDVEFIEIIKTDNLSKYGSNTFSGVINIIPKKRQKTNFNANYGSFNTSQFNFGTQVFSGSLSLNFLNSDGYKENTDYNTFNLFYNASFLNSKFMFGYLEKKFGAQDFYTTPSTRKEYEHTKTMLISVSKKISIFDFNVFLRSGYDFYTTNRYNPTDYSNYHNSYVYGLNLKTEALFKNIFIQPLFSFSVKHLDSKGFSSLFNWQGMGYFLDYESTLGSNLLFKYKKIKLDTSLLLNYYSRYHFIPQIGATLSYNATDNSRFFVSANQLHRIPSYTELFYWDPSHEGKSDLKVEKTFMYQLGADKAIKENLRISFSIFSQTPYDAIDWTRTIGTTRWYINNITKVETYGLNLFTTLNIGKFSSYINYTFAEKKFELDPTKELKYIENYPKHNLSLNFKVKEVLGFELEVLNNFRYLTKVAPNEIYLCGISLKRKIRNIDFRVSVENLFDIKYEEIKGVSAPKRNFNFGVYIGL